MVIVGVCVLVAVDVEQLWPRTQLFGYIMGMCAFVPKGMFAEYTHSNTHAGYSRVVDKHCVVYDDDAAHTSIVEVFGIGIVI